MSDTPMKLYYMTWSVSTCMISQQGFIISWSWSIFHMQDDHWTDCRFFVLSVLHTYSLCNSVCMIPFCHWLIECTYTILECLLYSVYALEIYHLQWLYCPLCCQWAGHCIKHIVYVLIVQFFVQHTTRILFYGVCGFMFQNWKNVCIKIHKSLRK